MKFIYTIILFLFTIGTGYAQKVFYQDLCNCGVTGAGYSFGINQVLPGNANIQINIEPGSLIRKAFLFGHRKGSASAFNFTFNSSSYQFNTSNQLTNSYLYFTGNGGVDYAAIHGIDITSEINPNQLSYHITHPPQPVLNGFEMFSAFYLFVVYEKLSLPPTAFSVILNEQDENNSVSYFINGLIPVEVNNPIGLALHTDIIWDTIIDGSYVKLNGNSIGLIGGSDASTPDIGAGVKGHFYYQNNTLFGLDDDTPDSIMTGSDGLADISTYVNSADTQLIIDLATQNAFHTANYYLAFFLAYTSPCDTFSVTHTPDTTICYGVPLQLQVQGGQAWEWSPQVGLSCYDCPNPIFTSDSSILYSVRVWNNDSCSKVFPLRIRVKEPLPDFNFAIQPSECGDSTGSVIITPILNGFSYINQTSQDTNTTGVFNTLSSGNYSFSILNADNCPFDTLIFVPETLSVNASFTSNPNAGVSPLHVVFNNTSTNASSYQWIYENQTSNQENLSYTFQQDGIYPIMLIAYGNSILCADTAYDTIYVYLPIEVEIPNIFTPNSDQNNDQWGIKINVPAEVDLQIFNRWGEIIVNRKEEVLSPGFVPLWDGGEHVGGVYYYVLRLKTDFEKKEFKGNLTLVR